MLTGGLFNNTLAILFALDYDILSENALVNNLLRACIIAEHAGFIDALLAAILDSVRDVGKLGHDKLIGCSKAIGSTKVERRVILVILCVKVGLRGSCCTGL